MSTVWRDPEAATEPESPPADGEQPVVPPYACEACGAGMQEGQDWCLDCGTAAPGRLGARPGWRAAATVVGLTLLLLVGAVAASYAALTGDAQREAGRPSSGSGNPITAQTPALGQPVTPGQTGPGTTAPPPVAPPPVATGGVQTTSGTSQSTTSGTGTSSSNSSRSSSSTGPRSIKLSSDAASLYDPDKRPGAEFGPASNAVDGKVSTVWDVTVPVDGESLGVGLIIDLGGLYKLKSLTMRTPISGFDVELYATKRTTAPPDILDSRWDHLTDRVDYNDGKTIPLSGRASGKVRLIALWFAEPPDLEDPRVAIGNVKVVGTK